MDTMLSQVAAGMLHTFEPLNILVMVVGLAVGYIALILEAPQFLGNQYTTENVRLFAGLGFAFGFGLIGFIDDYMKVVHTRNLGLTAKGKIVLQIVVSALYIFVMHRFGACDTTMRIPFIGSFDFGVWYYVLMMLVIIFMVNAVNLTDGIDGLATTVTFVVSVGFIVISTLLGYIGTGLFATAIAGACVGFVIWNFYPAKVFMGDTGSMFLGGAVVAMAYGVDFPLLVLVAGVVYAIEALSVVIQVTYFKLTHGKRLFKMTPIHHHFELSGFSEVKIDVTFAIAAALGAAVAVAAALFTP